MTKREKFTGTCLLVAAIATLAGCSSATKPAAVATKATTTTTPEPTTTPVAAWTKAESATHYLTIADATKASADGVKNLPADASLAATRAALTQYAQAVDTAVRDLAAGNWDPATKALIATQSADELKVRAVLQQIASDPSLAAVSADLSAQTSVFAAASADAESVRIALGLPPK